MPGYSVGFDEAASDVKVSRKDGVPFEIARRAVLEELGGMEGEIAQGDLSGRLVDDPDTVSRIDPSKTRIEGRTELDYRAGARGMSPAQAKVVETLAWIGETVGFYEKVETDQVAETVRSWIDGEATLDDLARSASVTSVHETLAALAVSMGTERPEAPGP